MASKFLDGAQRGASSGSIDLPLAALAALAVAFVAFVMPGDLLSRGVEISGLPSILSAAEPPLGTKARAAFALVAATGTFAAVFLLLRTLGGKSAPRTHPRDEEPEAPRLRRSDIHPDAPARRPILAGRDLGEPEAQPEPAPFWHPDDFPTEPEEDEAAHEPELRYESEAPKPEQLDELELAGPGIELIAAPAPVAAEAATIPDLMARLEQGLARRLRHKGVLPAPQQPSAAAGDPGHATVTTAAPEREPRPDEAEDDRLRSAIENLQRMAARAG